MIRRCCNAGTPSRSANAATIIEVGADLHVPIWGRVIAVAVAMQESILRNLPHLGDANDHDSVGLFQQRPSQGWGTPAQMQDPVYAATAFYQALLKVDGWQQMGLAEAGQAVQRSAHPDAYGRWTTDAATLVAIVASANGWAIPEDLEQCVSIDGWARPVPGQLTFGFRTASRPTHYGIDTTDARGTVVRAAAAGTVVVATCNATVDGQPYSCDVDGSPSVAGCGWYVDILQ